MKKLFIATTMVLAAISAQAATFTVDAKNNSSMGGVGLDTITLSAGQSFSVLASELDLWNAGDLPRYSNANGLIGNMFATGLDESGQLPGTQISQSFGTLTQNGFTAAYGQLVGQVGSQYFALGTNTTATTTFGGTLKLFYWDSVATDNTGSIAVSVTAVPEPETYAMLLAGLGLMGAVARRRKNKQA